MFFKNGFLKNGFQTENIYVRVINMCKLKKNVRVQNSKYEFKIIKNQRFSWVRESSAAEELLHRFRVSFKGK